MKTRIALRRRHYAFGAFATMTAIASRLLRESPMDLIENTESMLVNSGGDQRTFYEYVSDNLANVTDYPLKEEDTPVYWHIHKSGGTSMKDYYACMGLVEASEMGVIRHSDSEPELQVHDREGTYYVNVDVSRKEGSVRAKRLGLAKSGLADIFYTQFQFAAKLLFTPEYRGRVFTLLRHPVERSVSMFYYKQIASWENPRIYRPDLDGMNIGAWLKRGDFQDDVEAMYGNFMVARLVGGGPHNIDLTNDDLELAKDILRQKVLVGLITQIEESVNRFDKYFGWTLRQEEHPECFERFIRQGENINEHEHVQEGSDTWNKLAELAKYDVQLYEYALQLFDEQGKNLFGNDGATIDIGQ